MNKFLRGGRELSYDQGVRHLSNHPTKEKNIFDKPTQEVRQKQSECISRIAYTLPMIIFCVLFSWSLASPAFGQEATGLKKVQHLRVADKVSDDFSIKEHLFFVNGDTVRKSLKEYKGKLLLLDFWSTTCGGCIYDFPKINSFKKMYPEEFSVVMVNVLRTKDGLEKVAKVKERKNYKNLGFEQFVSIVLDTELDSQFGPIGFPYYVWINKYGYIQTITFRNLLDNEYKPPFLDL